MDARQRLYEVYPKHLARRGHVLDAAPSPPATPISSPWLPTHRAARVLELGCGSGETLRQLKATGFTELTGIDSTQSQIDRALAHGDGINYVTANATEYLSAHAGEYDLVCAFDFIEHLTVDEAMEICDLVNQALEPGGCFVLRTPNASSLLADYGWHSDLTHMTQYTEYSLLQLLDAAGFEDHHVLATRRPRIGPSFLRHPVEALHLRAQVNYLLHRFVYWARAQQRPKSFEKNLEVWTYKP